VVTFCDRDCGCASCVPSPPGWDAYAAGAGFTGEKKDSRGRRIYYQGGRRVKAPARMVEGGPCEPGERADLTGCTPTGGGGGTPGDAPAAADPAANRPSRPEERHPEAAPKPLPFRPPPPKKGKAGSGPVTRPTGRGSQTVVGDHAELLARRLGFRNILPAGQRANRPGEVAEKGSTIDTEYDHSGRAYELKTCNTTSTEYRLKAKKEEKDAKLRYAERNGLTAYVMVGVRDADTQEVHYYAAKEPGMTGAEVNEASFDYVGSVKYTEDEFAAFVKEQAAAKKGRGKT
jgi:hypothetical protein